MRIQGIPKTAKKIYKAHAGSEKQFKAWNRRFKKVEDTTLVAIIERMLQSPEHYNSTHWKFAGVALNELVIRPWGKKNTDKLYKLRDALVEVSKHCFSAQSYSLETAGIKATAFNKRAKKRKIIHPYAYSDTALEVIKAWQKSQTTKSLEEYIASLSKEEKKALKAKNIKYLSPKERDQYLVTFMDQFILIGDKTPKDDWYIFVLGGNKTKLYAGIKEKGSFHHTSFLGAEPILCAGEFQIKAGKIERILLRSGHYRPVLDHGELLMRYLEKPEMLGPHFAGLLEVEPYDN